MTFVIQRMGPDSEQLPASHTCFNTLDLPVCTPSSISSIAPAKRLSGPQEYASEEKLRVKLTTSLMHFQGFGLV